MLRSASCRLVQGFSINATKRLWSIRSLTTNLSSAAHSGENAPWNHMSESTRALATELLNKTSNPWAQRLALSKAITLVESTAEHEHEEASLLLTHLLRTQGPNYSFRVGIAGPPGAGKSTFIEALGMYILDRNQSKIWSPASLAVLCVDPSSALTGGSIMGDKTRMADLSRDPRAFVRPASTRGGSMGGLAPRTDDVLRLVEAVGRYPLILVETVGLGQSEIEVTRSVDMLVLLVPPAGGDDLQGVKKGIVEVTDLVVVTKADGDLLNSARVTAADYKGAMPFVGGFFRKSDRQTPVLLASAYTGQGLDAVWDQIVKFRQDGLEVYQDVRREQNHYWMWKNLRLLVEEETHRNPILHAHAQELMDKLNKGSIPPRVAAAALLETLKESSSAASK